MQRASPHGGRAIRSFAACVLVLLAVAVSSFGGTGPIPDRHATMPEPVSNLLAAALAARTPRAAWESAAAESSRRALAALRRTPLPDPSRMQRVRIARGGGPGVLGWTTGDAPPVPDRELPLLRTEARSAASATPVDFGAEIDEAVSIVRAEREGRAVRVPGPITGATSFRGGGPDTGLLRRAIWAAWLGRDTEARTLADAAVSTGADVIDRLLAEETERSYVRGVRLLVAGAPRADALAVWDAALPWAREEPGSTALRDLVADLREQVGRERDAGPSADVEPGSLPPAERAAWLVARFPDVSGTSFHFPAPEARDDAPRWADAAVRLGRDAVPALLAALGDRRLTRIPVLVECDLVGLGMRRVQDLAADCLREIAGGDGPSFPAALSEMPPRDCASAVASIRTWWAANGHATELERRLSRIHEPDIGNLLRIEAIDPRAVDAVAVLREWAGSAGDDVLVAIAAELGRRGDVSLRPRIREADARRRSFATISYLVAHGDASDVRRLVAAQRADRRRSTRAGDESAAWPDVARAAAAVRRPESVPLLLDALRARETTGSRSVPGASTVPFSVADTSIEALVAITGHPCGYDPAAPASERHAAIDRWTAWWDAEGAAAFARARPDLADLVVASPPSDDAVARALASQFVVVPSAGLAAARWSIPRDDAARLLGSGGLTARTGPDGEAELEFAGPDAEGAWSRQAAGAGECIPSLSVELERAWCDSRGRLLGFERYGDSRFLRFDGRWAEIPRTESDPSWEHALPDDVVAGADGAVLVVERDGPVHLLDDEVPAHARTFDDLARGHGARIRRAFRGVVVHRPSHRALIAVDGRDRIWWRDAREPGITVADRDAVVVGVLPVLREADPPYDRAVVALAPAGGGRATVFTDASSGALLDLAGGSVAVVAKFAVRGLHSTPREVTVLPDGTVHLDGRPIDAASGAWADDVRGLLAAPGPDGARWYVSAWNPSNPSTLRHVAADGRVRVLDLPGDDGAVDVEPDGAAAAWVGSRTGVRHVRVAADRLVESLRIPFPDGERTLRTGGPGRVWILGPGRTTGVRATLLCAGRP